MFSAPGKDFSLTISMCFYYTIGMHKPNHISIHNETDRIPDRVLSNCTCLLHKDDNIDELLGVCIG